MRKALVLVGHGSARNPDTRKPICAMVKTVRERGGFDEVRCGLWKEEPHVSITLDKLESEDITIVPFFIADGYYTGKVIPEQMELEGAVTRRDGKIIRYTRAVGSHPAFADLILSHAREAGWRPGDSLVVLGHGTPKHPGSGVNIYLQAERIRARYPGEDVCTLFIDEPPFVTDAWRHCRGQRIVVVPLFVADGWHVTETIPEDLGLQDGRVVRDNRELVMTSAVGQDPGLVEVILLRAREAQAFASVEKV